MQTQGRTTFRNWFSLPTLGELRIELSSLGWLQASSPDEQSHLPKYHFFSQPEDEYLHPELQCRVQQVRSVEIYSY